MVTFFTWSLVYLILKRNWEQNRVTAWMHLHNWIWICFYPVLTLRMTNSNCISLWGIFWGKEDKVKTVITGLPLRESWFKVFTSRCNVDMNIGKILTLSRGSCRLLYNGRSMRRAVDYWKLNSSRTPEVLFLSAPKLSIADQEMKARGVLGIDLVVRYPT